MTQNDKVVELNKQHFQTKIPRNEVDGKQVIVRNGYLPVRTIQTGLEDLEIKVPKAGDRSGEGHHFTSALLPPYFKRTNVMEEFIPWLYLKGFPRPHLW